MTTAALAGYLSGAELSILKYTDPGMHEDTGVWQSVFFLGAALAGLTIGYSFGVPLFPDNRLGFGIVPLTAIVGAGWYKIFYYPVYKVIVRFGGADEVSQWVLHLFGALNSGIFTAATLYILSMFI
jgi:hypothetical protein